MRNFATWLACTLICVGCGNDFAPGSRVEKLRLLALRADLPTAHPGETVSLEALAYDPEGRALTWGWATCPTPEGSTVDACLAALDPSTVVLAEDMPTHTISIAEDALPEGVGREAAYVGVIVAVCPGTLELVPSEGSPFTCRDGEGNTLALYEHEVGMKRIRVRERDRNENPALLGVTLDGQPWPEDEVPTLAPCTTDEIDTCEETTVHAVEVSVGPIESGVDELGVEFEEQTLVQYYATAGHFEHELRTAASPATTFAATGEGELTLWFVVRDERGGSSWTSRRVRLGVE